MPKQYQPFLSTIDAAYKDLRFKIEGREPKKVIEEGLFPEPPAQPTRKMDPISNDSDSSNIAGKLGLTLGGLGLTAYGANEYFDSNDATDTLTQAKADANEVVDKEVQAKTQANVKDINNFLATNNLNKIPEYHSNNSTVFANTKESDLAHKLYVGGEGIDTDFEKALNKYHHGNKALVDWLTNTDGGFEWDKLWKGSYDSTRNNLLEQLKEAKAYAAGKPVPLKMGHLIDWGLHNPDNGADASSQAYWERVANEIQSKINKLDAAEQEMVHNLKQQYYDKYMDEQLKDKLLAFDKAHGGTGKFDTVEELREYLKKHKG